MDGRPGRGGGLERDGGAAPRRPRARLAEGDEVVTSPFSFVASANCLLYEGVRPVFCDVDPVTLNIDPEAAAAAVSEKTVGLLPVHIFGWPAAMPDLERLADDRGLGILEDACEALGAVDEEGAKVGARGHLATFAFYANKQMTTGEGGMVVRARPRTRGAAAQPSATRAAVPTWAGSSTSGSASTTGSRSSPARSAWRRSSGLIRCWRNERGWQRPTRRRSQRWTASRRRSASRGQEQRSWFVYVATLDEGIDRDGVIARLAERGIPSKAYLPCIHLFPHLRELGYREGQFPVAEAASARSLALPFFGQMTRDQVDQVCGELAAVLAAG